MSARDLAQYGIDAIERGDFDVDGFDHEAHVYAAWQFLAQFPRDEAIERFSGALQRVTRRLGVPEKYNETVTWFYMLLIDERRRDGDDWAVFQCRNPDLFDRSDSILRRYYSAERLRSEAARSKFLLPDRVAA